MINPSGPEMMLRLVDAYLDKTLESGESDALNKWVQADPKNALAFSRRVRLHDGLREILARESPAESYRVKRVTKTKKWRSLQMVGALSLVAAMTIWAMVSQPVSAAREMERLIRVSSSESAGTDRTYRITNLDDLPEEEDEKRPPVDGAILHVRPPDQYVLVRRFPDGREWTTGSDGETGWSVPPEGAGAVRVSADPLRFRGPVPGHQSGIPFANLSADLNQIRLTYELTLQPALPDGSRGLLARKRSALDRGPREVEIRYDPRSGVILGMVFHGMPRARGGPDRVAVDLVDQKPLGPGFFSHSRHHDQARKVIQED